MDIKNAGYVGKIVIVGDPWCGKTSFVHVAETGEFPSDAKKKIHDTFYREEQFDQNVTVYIQTWDTACESHYEQIRPLAYDDADFILLCYGVDSRAQFASIGTKWLEEMQKMGVHSGLYLIGLKSDLRDDPEYRGCQFVSEEEGVSLARNIGATKYYEISAKANKNVDALFHEIGCEIKEKRKREFKEVKKPWCGCSC